MLKFLSFIFIILFNLTISKKSLLIKLAILEKEVEILNRQNKKKSISPSLIKLSFLS